MRIGFFGTPEIAEYCLSKLITKHEIAFVVTGQDKPSGRHLKIRYSPVKRKTLERGIKIIQPANLHDKNLINELKEDQADIYIVVAYGKIIPSEVFTIPRHKTLNLHPSLLPKYRGAAPIQWVILNGESETGITVQLLNERLDAGDILRQVKIPLNNTITAEELYQIVLPEGAELLLETINLLGENRIKPKKQNEAEATYCKIIDSTIPMIDWHQPSFRIHNLIRGLNPKPVAWTTFRGKKIKIWKTGLLDNQEYPKNKPGDLTIYNKKRLIVGTADGGIEILQIQPETKRKMDSLSFINGYRLQKGESVS